MVRLQYTIHQHNAKKAGPHFDLRLEKGNEVHSFALPKNKLPDDKHVYLAIKTHVDDNKGTLDFYGHIHGRLHPGRRRRSFQDQIIRTNRIGGRF